MSKLTSKSDWDYSAYSPPENSHFAAVSADKSGWIGIVHDAIPDEGSFIELGCAPGYCSAAVTYGKHHLSAYGVDFSDSAECYLNTMRSVGKPDAVLYKADLFTFEPSKQFDCVGSFGLIEHFSNGDLKKILALHDKCLRPGGLLVIEIPNFTGFQGLWHSLFDRPSYKLHNTKTMHPRTFDFFNKVGYTQVFCDYVGNLSLWGDTGLYKSAGLTKRLLTDCESWINRKSIEAAKAGKAIKGPLFSPALLYIARKAQEAE